MTPYYDHAGIRIYLGDCRDVLPSLARDDFAALMTDPPYGIGHSSNHGASWEGTQIAGDDSTAMRDHVLAWWGDRPALVFGTWKTPPPNGTRAALAWDKGPASGMGDLRLPWKGSWETIYVLGGGFVGSRDEGVLRGMTVVTWESFGRKHPHEKPVKLLAYLLAKCPPGAIIDPFVGSGTTLVAAKQLGHRAVGIEIEERYCEVAVTRLAQEVLPLAAPDGPQQIKMT